MATSPQTGRDRAEDEAATWLVLLSEAPEDMDLRARFEAWRGADDVNAEMWDRTCRAYDLLGRGMPQHRDHWVSYAAARNIARDLPSAVASRPAADVARRFTVRRLAVAAASMALAASLAVAFLPGLLLRMEADAVTGTGEVRTVILADGSQVSLAPDSAIDVAFAGSHRRVRVLKGEAYFEVTHDPARPFSVAAGDTVATVLGTGFDVRRDTDEAEVAVRHGHVRVDDTSVHPAVSEDLLAGDWVRVNWHGGAVRGTELPDDIADWRRGELVARDRPAGEIVEVLRRYYAGAILVHDDAFADRRVSGLYDLRHPEETLRDLATAHGARVRRVSPWLLIVTGG